MFMLVIGMSASAERLLVGHPFCFWSVSPESCLIWSCWRISASSISPSGEVVLGLMTNLLTIRSTSVTGLD
jgi:hypothetical protein